MDMRGFMVDYAQRHWVPRSSRGMTTLLLRGMTTLLLRGMTTLLLRGMTTLLLSGMTPTLYTPSLLLQIARRG